jgi:hypothetical protein
MRTARLGVSSRASVATHDLIDEEGGVAPLAGRIPSETDRRALLGMAVSITHNICERCGDIIGRGVRHRDRRAGARGRAR